MRSRDREQLQDDALLIRSLADHVWSPVGEPTEDFPEAQTMTRPDRQIQAGRSGGAQGL